MSRIRSRELYEAEELLEEVVSWSDDRIKRLPKFYQEKAQKYRRLANSGDACSLIGGMDYGKYNAGDGHDLDVSWPATIDQFLERSQRQHNERLADELDQLETLCEQASADKQGKT